MAVQVFLYSKCLFSGPFFLQNPQYFLVDVVVEVAIAHSDGLFRFFALIKYRIFVHFLTLTIHGLQNVINYLVVIDVLWFFVSLIRLFPFN